MLIGSSVGVSVRVTVSTPIRKIAPIRAETGNNLTLLGPVNILEKCGITKPIHPTVPLMQIAAAVSSVAQSMITVRSNLTFAPSKRASSSPIERISTHHDSANSPQNPIIIAGRVLTRLA